MGFKEGPPFERQTSEPVRTREIRTRESTMDFQEGPTFQRETPEPVLSPVGDIMTWYVSNLCFTQIESSSSSPKRRRDRPRCWEQSIYPSKEDLVRYLPADIDTSYIFMPHDRPPMSGYISDCSSNATPPSSSRRSVERELSPAVRVEVYPGEFLPLRGAKETFEAIERGHSKSVVCCACGLGLRCVADCELVICPECRIMSPVPRPRRSVSLLEDTEYEDEKNHPYRSSLPQFAPLWSDEDESNHSPEKEKSSVVSTGGVGLGLIIENY
jgi:hypothetical protein